MDYSYCVCIEAAKLLREKGYNEETDYTFEDDGNTEFDWRENIDFDWRTNQDLPDNMYSCPSRAEAIDWLEQKHGIRIEIRMKHCKIKGDPMEIKDTDEYAWRWFYAICIGDDVDNPILEEESEGSEYVKLFNSRLEAENAAIIRALKEINKL